MGEEEEKNEVTGRLLFHQGDVKGLSFGYTLKLFPQILPCNIMYTLSSRSRKKDLSGHERSKKRFKKNDS